MGPQKFAAPEAAVSLGPQTAPATQISPASTLRVGLAEQGWPRAAVPPWLQRPTASQLKANPKEGPKGRQLPCAVPLKAQAASKPPSNCGPHGTGPQVVPLQAA
jgi:hypothetical protein